MKTGQVWAKFVSMSENQETMLMVGSLERVLKLILNFLHNKQSVDTV